jgi:hypothetical protein
MTPADIEPLLTRIASLPRDDDDTAYAVQHAMYELVLHFIAQGKCKDPQALAQEALRSKERWMYR